MSQQLDHKRKVILVVAGIIMVVLLFLGRPTSQTQTVAAQTIPAATTNTESNSTAAAPEPEKEAPMMAQANLEVPVANEAEPVEAVQETAAPASTAEPVGLERFIVYQDKPSKNLYVASGFMPSAQCVSLTDTWTTSCHEGRSCIKATFDGACAIKEQGWAGVYWLNPANNWGDQKGGHNLKGATKLYFWAKGETGEEVINFKIGGVGKNADYPDSDEAESGPTVLSKAWQQYSIDLTGKNLSHIVGGFAWVASGQDNPGAITFYLDDIHYE